METHYPGLIYAPERWKTTDGFIPWIMALGLLRRLASMQAERELDMTHAVQLGTLLAENPKDHHVERAYRALRRLAEGKPDG